MGSPMLRVIIGPNTEAVVPPAWAVTLARASNLLSSFRLLIHGL